MFDWFKYGIRYIAYRPARWILERQIKSALSKRVATQQVEELGSTAENVFIANPQNPLFRWLHIAADCSGEDGESVTDLLKYQLSNQESLAAYMLRREQEAGARKQTLLSQRYIANAILLFQAQQKHKYFVPSKPKLTFWQGVLSWVLRGSPAMEKSSLMALVLLKKRY